MAFLFNMFLGDGILFEGKNNSFAHLADAALLSPIKCCRWLMREERRRVGKENVREVRIR